MKDLFIESVQKVVANVFQTIFEMPVQYAGAMVAANSPIGQNTAGIIGIIGVSGDVSGFIAVHLKEAVGIQLAGKMVGSSYTEVNADVKDAIGEIANIVAGNLKDEFKQNNVTFKISTPMVVMGKDLFAKAVHPLQSIITSFSLPDQGMIHIEFASETSR